ncbi:hypothetical protein [Chitinophaga sp.]|uniref:hypothetical protein n=1 Tax=Chitinophaga sp. TaxID=1869181 RepID=UPI0031DC4D03
MRVLSLLFYLFVFAHSAHAQFFVADKGACPGAGDAKNTLKFDTLFYAPDKAMPFDRCFVMVVPYAHPKDVVGFAISPVDKDGKPNPRRRDYNAFIKSGFHTRASRKQERREFPFDSFRSQSFVRIFTSLIPGGDEKNPTLILKVSPLDPDREYRIYLLLKDTKSVEQLMATGDILFNSYREDVFTPPVYDSAVKSYKQFEKQRAKMGGAPDFETFAAQNGPLATRDMDSTLKDFKKKFPRNKYRILQYQHYYFVDSTGGYLPPDPQLTSSLNRLTIADSSELQQVSLLTLVRHAENLHLKDVNGADIVLQNHTYLIYRVTEDSVFTSKGFNTHQFGPVNKLGKVAFGNPDSTGICIASWQPKADIMPVEAISSLYETKAASMSKIKEQETSNLCTMNKEALQLLIKAALDCDCEEDVRKNIVAENDTIKALSILYNGDAATFRNILLGIYSLDNINKETDADELKQRISNLETSIKVLNNVREYVLKVRAIAPAHEAVLADLTDCIDKEKKRYTIVSKQLKTIASADEHLKELYLNQFSLVQSVPVSTASSQVLELTSSAKFRIVPEFGLVSVFKTEGSFGFQDLVPYLGFNINFRSIDKDIPMRFVRYKTWRHYFSFVAGITLRSLAVQGKREDFFGNSSLLTGLGLRLSNYIKLTGGTLWFKATDPNPVSTNKPIRILPYAGVSLDLELRELFGGVAKIFTL